MNIRYFERVGDRAFQWGAFEDDSIFTGHVSSMVIFSDEKPNRNIGYEIYFSCYLTSMKRFDYLARRTFLSCFFRPLFYQVQVPSHPLPSVRLGSDADPILMEELPAKYHLRHEHKVISRPTINKEGSKYAKH